jgi:hypothetical protein
VPAVGIPALTGSQGVLAHAGRVADEDDFSPVRTAAFLIAASGLVVVLALTLATTSLRRRMGSGPATGPAARE